ncbi:MAG: dihydroorotate dehydrogenase-like protein [Deltaproteobacteria bacterium]|nr:dihydroorotate dehydrogenase-like protein [Deltaproteobacteria bacterium]
MDLSTTYLGLELPHPLVSGAGPLSDSLDDLKRLEDAGAAAVVLRSLFEEQLTGEELAAHHALEHHADSFAEATTYLPAADEFAFGPHEYLEHLSRSVDALEIPVMASLNGTSAGGWVDFATQLADAGAAAIELNLYHLPTDPSLDSAQLEAGMIELVKQVKAEVTVPIAVKLSPFFSALSNFAEGLERAGADGLVLFNRFYQPDIDPEELEVDPALHLSDRGELLLRLQWLGILSAQRKLSLACTGGVHEMEDVLKAVMSGAHTVQLVSALLKAGPAHLETLRDGLGRWLEEHEYASLAQARGSMNLARCPDPAAFTRGNYMQIVGTARRFLS